MEERNIIKWSEYSGYTELTIPSGEIWMSESEMVDLFGVFIPKLRNAIKALYKEELIKPFEAERTIKVRRNVLADNVTAQLIRDEKRNLFLHINETPITQWFMEQFGLSQSQTRKKGFGL